MMAKSDDLLLDRLDRKILNELQRDASRSNKDLAEQVGTSAASCLRRIKRLRESGLIAAQIAVINREMTGDGVVAMTTIQLSSHNAQERDALIRLLREMPEVSQCYMITGGEDMLVLSNLSSLTVFEGRIAQRISDCDVVVKLSTTIAYKTLKFSPFVEFEDESWESLPPTGALR